MKARSASAFFTKNQVDREQVGPTVGAETPLRPHRDGTQNGGRDRHLKRARGVQHVAVHVCHGVGAGEDAVL